MNRKSFGLLVIFLTASLLYGGSRFVDRHPPVADAIELLELWIEEQMAYRQMPGLTIGIVYDQELIWAKGYGYADLEQQVPATSQTLYRIGSVTKLFTATAIMQLRDAGQLRLDDPIKRHLPWFQIQNRFPDAPDIIFWHLLTHTSGLPRNAAFPHWTDHKFPTREELIAALPDQELVYPPGSRVKYSNLGATLAGEVVRAVSGESYETYIHEHILEPLGMTSSGVIAGQEELVRMAAGYTQRNPPDSGHRVIPHYETKGMAAMGNMYSTVEDLARLLALQFRDGPAGGNQILKGSTLREMRRVHWLYSSWNSGRGLEMLVARHNGKTIVYRTGSLAGHQAYIMFNPAEKIGVICLANADDAEPRRLGNKAYDAVSPAIVKAVTPKPEKKKADPAWKRYLGEYVDPWGWEYKVLILNSELIIYEYNYPPEDDPRDGASLLVPVSKHTFRRASDGKPVTFEVGTKGKIERIRWGYDYIYPKDHEPDSER